MTQTSSSHHRIVIVGGGTAGITVAARLRRKGLAADIAIIEPSDKHYYQPAWTLVGGGAYSLEATERQFLRLLAAYGSTANVYVFPFALPAEQRSEVAATHVETHYSSFSELRDQPSGTMF